MFRYFQVKGFGLEPGDLTMASFIAGQAFFQPGSKAIIFLLQRLQMAIGRMGSFRAATAGHLIIAGGPQPIEHIDH